MKNSLFLAILMMTPSLVLAHPAFKCAGTEPFWGLTINRQAIAFTHENMVTEIQAVKPTHTQNEWRYDSHITPSMEPISILIKKENCSDGMSDKQYHYGVSYTVNNQIFKGCCEKVSKYYKGEK